MIRFFGLSLFFLLFSGCIQIQTRSTLDEGQSHKVTSEGARHENEDLEVELKLLENRLKGSQEIEQYTKALPYFQNLKERVTFLGLNTFKARQKWFIEQDFWSRVNELDRKFAAVIKGHDIAVGMTSDQLKKSWGDPTQVFVSGLPQFGNGRWVYVRQVSTPDGFKAQKRVVYLESGLVTGWDTQ